MDGRRDGRRTRCRRHHRLQKRARLKMGGVLFLFFFPSPNAVETDSRLRVWLAWEDAVTCKASAETPHLPPATAALAVQRRFRRNKRLNGETGQKRKG